MGETSSILRNANGAHRKLFDVTEFYRMAEAGAALVVEVAQTSLQYDTRVKMPLYARYGIPESWLVDVDAASITVYRSPTHDGYEDIKTYQEAERIEPRALPGVLIEVADIVTN